MLEESAANVRADLEAGAPVHVSGHEAMSAPARAAFESLAGADEIAQRYDDMHDIDST